MADFIWHSARDGSVGNGGSMTATLFFVVTKLHNRDSVVSIATGYGLDDRGVGVRVPVGSRIFSSPSYRFWGPPNLLFDGYRGPGREVDLSPPASAKVKKMWIHTSTPPYVFMA
jgi:hypothetical protein